MTLLHCQLVSIIFSLSALDKKFVASQKRVEMSWNRADAWVFITTKVYDGLSQRHIEDPAD